MPRSLSLSTKKDFDSLFRQGKRKYSKNFTLIYTYNNELLFAPIIPKKIAVKASSRNYSKRIMRSVFRKFIKVKELGNLHIALISRIDLKEFSKSNNYQLIEKELVSLFNQLHN